MRKIASLSLSEEMYASMRRASKFLGRPMSRLLEEAWRLFVVSHQNVLEVKLENLALPASMRNPVIVPESSIRFPDPICACGHPKSHHGTAAAKRLGQEAHLKSSCWSQVDDHRCGCRMFRARKKP